MAPRAMLFFISPQDLPFIMELAINEYPSKFFLKHISLLYHMPIDKKLHYTVEAA
jgi:hypothetical protein